MTQNINKGLQKTDITGMKRGALFTLMIILGSLLAAQVVFPGDAERNAAVDRRDRFVQAARVYLGTPYVSGGTGKSGMDCSGLVYRAAMDGLGLAVPRTVAALSSDSDQVPDRDREPGDLLFFNTIGRLSHVGIYLGNGSFIHAASDGPKTGVIISSLSENYWKQAYLYTGRILKASGLADDATNAPEEQTSAPFVDPFPFTGNIGIRLSAIGGVLWDIMPEEVPVRGGSAIIEASWARGIGVYPGIGAGLSFDTRSESLSVPLFLSITIKQGFRLFAGTQFHLMADSGLDRTPLFPGIAGVSWHSKPVDFLGQKMRFYQSAEYSRFRDETFNEGFRFTTGLSFVYDI